MIRSIWRIVRDPEEAQDTLQEALVTIWNRFERIIRHPNPRALILKICIDKAYDMIRKKSRIPTVSNQESALTNVTDSNLSASEMMFEKEEENEIMDAISQLPQNQAVAVLMRIVQDCSYAEIAQVLNCEESTVRIHVSRGRAQLGKTLSHLVSRFGSEVSQ